MEGNTGTASITVEEVWRAMPRQASGPHWAAAIQEAIERYQDWKRYNIGATAEQARESGMVGEYADGWPSVYTGSMWEGFHNLDLWNVDEVEDMVGQLLDHYADINEMARLYCYAAATLTMEAVLAVAEKHEEGGYLCDRCRDRFPFDRIRYVFLGGFGALCPECYEGVRAEGVPE